MRYNFFILLVIASSIACSCRGQQTGFTIKGTLTGKLDSTFMTDSVFLSSEDRTLASSALIDGKFELKGSVTEPQMVSILTRKNGVGRIILENADYTYTCDNGKIRIKGGTLNRMVLASKYSDEYDTAVAVYYKSLDSLLNGKAYEDFTPEERKILSREVKTCIEVESRSINKVLDAPNAPVLAKVFAVTLTQEWDKYPMEKRLTLLDAYDKELGGNNKQVAKMRANFERMREWEANQKAMGTGRLFKDVNALDVNGNVVKLSDVIAKNKYTILEFWASWCSPCRGEIPNLKKAYAKYKSKGLEIYAVSLDDKKGKWLQALKDEDVPWISLNDPAAFKGEAAKDYSIMGVPASFLIGQDGKIVVSNDKLRGKELEKTLSEYMP